MHTSVCLHFARILRPTSKLQRHHPTCFLQIYTCRPRCCPRKPKSRMSQVNRSDRYLMISPICAKGMVTLRHRSQCFLRPDERLRLTPIPGIQLQYKDRELLSSSIIIRQNSFQFFSSKFEKLGQQVTANGEYVHTKSSMYSYRYHTVYQVHTRYK